MFKKKAKKVEEAPKRIKLLGASDHRIFNFEDGSPYRSSYNALTDVFAKKISGVIEYEDQLLDILESSPKFHELNRQRLQRQLDVKLKESSAISQEIIDLAKAVQS